MFRNKQAIFRRSFQVPTVTYTNQTAHTSFVFLIDIYGNSTVFTLENVLRKVHVPLFWGRSENVPRLLIRNVPPQNAPPFTMSYYEGARIVIV